jgi:hypothetical protein
MYILKIKWKTVNKRENFKNSFKFNTLSQNESLCRYIGVDGEVKEAVLQKVSCFYKILHLNLNNN